MIALLFALQPAPLDLNGTCEWGPVQHQAGRVIIDGHVWTASGAVQIDGSIQLIWTDQDSGRGAIGVYKAQAGGLGVALTGKWGWLDEIHLDKSGKLTGKTTEETITIQKCTVAG